MTAAQMREADRLTTERFDVPSLTLMENAGARVVEAIAAGCGDLAARRIVVLCGKGNNGGDGFVVGRFLRQRGANPWVFLFGSSESVRGDAAVNLKRWQGGGGKLQEVKDASEWAREKAALESADVIVDALLGTGLTGPAEGLLAAVIEDVNRAALGAAVFAVDTPSGLPSGTEKVGGPVVRAHTTVTFTAPKLGQLASGRSASVGRLVVAPIGTPSELVEELGNDKLRWIEPGEFRELCFERPADANKGNYGHALIVAGSRGKTGAAVLAARGALRAGAGLVTVATPKEMLGVVAAGAAEMMTAPLAATDDGTISLRNLDYGRFRALLDKKTVLAVGPGLTTHTETQQFVITIVKECELPLILDADGLNAFAGRSDDLAQRKGAPLAVSPHPGEMARLLGSTAEHVQANRLQTALDAAARWKAHVVLKGYRTILATPDGRAYFNSTGNPGMASGGTGDVLTGMLAGFTAQFGAARWEKILALGVYLHGLAGDFAAARVGEAPLIASDLVEAIPEAWRHLRAELVLRHG